MSTLLRRARTAALTAYRATGADLPYGDPTRAHGVAMEGYFWRFTTPDGRTVIALCGINRDGTGAHWTTAGLAASSGGQVMTCLPGGTALADRLGVVHEAFTGDGHGVRAQLAGLSPGAPGGGPAEQDAHLDVRIEAPRHYPAGALRPYGGSSVFQSVPALNQYWHPWLLGGRAQGRAVVGGVEIDLDGAEVYGEKNWGREGFPDAWWWGQAHGFGDGAALAFAGGDVVAGPVRTEVTGLVVALPDGGPVIRLGNPVVSPVRARVTDEEWHLRGRGFGWEVHVTGGAPLAEAHVLPVPLPSRRSQVPGAIEHLAARVEVVVRRRGRVVWRGESRSAGLEHGGLDRAAAELRRRGIDPATAVGTLRP